MTRLLDLRDLAVEFRSERGVTRAVNGVSLHVDAGETLAIVGESGSGKSVTALSIMRLLGDAGSVVAGAISFDGQDLLAMPERRMRAIRGNKIAMIFQEPMSSLNPVMTVGRQVAEPIQTHQGATWPSALAEAADLLEKVAIPDARARLGDYPHRFSGGMRQRVMIAMALACKPQLIIADEPTTALDVTVQAQILTILKQLTRELKSALILITHDLGLVARYAERVAVMYAGRIVETAATRDLFSNPHHPYTLGLLASVPRLDGVSRLRLASIAGQPPDLAALPPGCAFAPRCRYVKEACQTAPPPLLTIARDHISACIGHD